MPRGKSDRSIVRATISIGGGVERRGERISGKCRNKVESEYKI